MFKIRGVMKKNNKRSFGKMFTRRNKVCDTKYLFISSFCLKNNFVQQIWIKIMMEGEKKKRNTFPKKKRDKYLDEQHNKNDHVEPLSGYH